jgi:putative ABC transport system permease protein
VFSASDAVRTPGRTYDMTVVGRLRPSVTMEQAAAQMSQIRDALAVEHPRWFEDRGVVVRPLQDAIVGTAVRSWMLLLLGAVGFVLLIACLNVANLLLARAVGRNRELAVRAALGATRWDLARSLVVESLLLSALGTACGVLAALWGVRVLRLTLPEHLPRLAEIAVDLRVLAAAVVAAAATGLFFGTLPALQFSRADHAGALRQGGRTATGGQGLRTVLVLAEVALAVVLLAGAGLFISSFMRVVSVDLGLNPEHVVSINVSLRRQTPAQPFETRIAVSHPLLM